tara:strand:- start:1741 stop:1959 length:219 start_codon:yes stop_codon:yes gene_type:complete
MVKLKILENCLNILQIQDKNKIFPYGINQSMINKLNIKHRFGADLILSVVKLLPQAYVCRLSKKELILYDRS